jgi:hypothetical protein
MRGQHRKAAHHARVMRDDISDIGGASHMYPRKAQASRSSALHDTTTTTIAG